MTRTVWPSSARRRATGSPNMPVAPITSIVSDMVLLLIKRLAQHTTGMHIICVIEKVQRMKHHTDRLPSLITKKPPRVENGSSDGCSVAVSWLFCVAPLLHYLLIPETLFSL